jgi:hypothetical protein
MLKAILIDDPFDTTPSVSAPVNKLTNDFDHIRTVINSVYAGFNMVKTMQSGPWGVYKAQVNTLLSGDYKYIVCIVQGDSIPLGGIMPLAKLSWNVFQTRSTMNIQTEMNGYNLPGQSYVIPSGRKTLLYDKIKMIDETDKKCVYLSDNLPIKVEVLKNKPEEWRAPEGTIIGALELFNTVITLVEM